MSCCPRSPTKAAGVQVLRDSEAAAGAVSFQTEDELYVWPLEAVAAGKTPTDDGAADARADALDRAGLDEDEATFYRTVLTSADPGGPDAETIDVSDQVDRALWVALLTRPTIDLAALSRRTVFLGIGFDETFEESSGAREADAGRHRVAALGSAHRRAAAN